jgi:hypothetical protein
LRGLGARRRRWHRRFCGQVFPFRADHERPAREC